MRSSQTMNAIIEISEMTVAQQIHAALNQSSCWPRSRIDLQRGQPEGHHAEADVVDVAAAAIVGGAEVGRVFHKACDIVPR